MADELREKVLSGRAWAEFCDALKEVGALVLDPRAPADPLDRAEGYRFLMRLVRYGFEGFLEFNDPLAPKLHRGSHETIKIIHENPDNLYLGARVDGRHVYRIWGKLGTARWMSFNVHAGAFGAGGRGTAEALDARALELGPDRSFELILGGEREGRTNWMPLPADAGSLIVRQTFADRATERPSELSIERLDAGERPAPLAPEKVGQALATTPALLRALVGMALSWSDDLAKTKNRFSEVMPGAAAVFRDPNIHFHAAYFELADGRGAGGRGAPAALRLLDVRALEPLARDARLHAPPDHAEQPHREARARRLGEADRGGARPGPSRTGSTRRATRAARSACAGSAPTSRT